MGQWDHAQHIGKKLCLGGWRSGGTVRKDQSESRDKQHVKKKRIVTVCLGHNSFAREETLDEGIN